jgi:valyl-tRNA synthetase
MHRCIGEVTVSLEAYRFDEAANTLYHFIWHEYCDWYLELAKPALADKASRQAALTRTTLIESVETLLRLLHPFMPFITEEIWQAIPHTGESIMVSPYPVQDRRHINEDIEQEFEGSLAVVSGIREIRGTQKIPPSKKLAVSVATPNVAIAVSLKSNESLIASLGWVTLRDIGVSVQPQIHVASTTVTFPGGGIGQIHVDLAGLIDVGKEKARIEKHLKELAAQMDQDQKKLLNPDFVAKVPPDVLKKTKARHEECRAEHDKLAGELRRLNQMAGGSA